jgi:hypothetical protein
MPRLRPARFVACAICIAVFSTTAVLAAPTATGKGKASPARVVEGGNLLLNPGFENPLPGHPWMPAKWDTSETPLPTVFFGRDTFLVHSGSYAVNVANMSTTFPMWHNWNQTVLVGPETWGKDLVFSVWTRSNGLQGRAYVMVQAYRDTIGKMGKIWDLSRDATEKRLHYNHIDDPLIDLGWRREYFSEPETDWVRRELRVYVAPTTNIIYVRLGLFGTGQVIFDDASLTLAPALPAPEVPLHVNLFQDPSFEGDGNAWEYAMPIYENMEVSADSTVAHTGRFSVRGYGGMGGMVSTRAGVCQVLPNRNLAGKHLRLSGFIRTDSLAGSAYVKIYCHTLHGMVQSEPSATLGLTAPWTEIVAEMDAPPDTYEVWAWLMYNAPVAGKVYFDDGRLEVTGEATVTSPPRPAPTTRPAGSKSLGGKSPGSSGTSGTKAPPR